MARTKNAARKNAAGVRKPKNQEVNDESEETTTTTTTTTTTKKNNKRKLEDDNNNEEEVEETNKDEEEEEDDDEETDKQVDKKIKSTEVDFNVPAKSEKQMKIISWNVAGFKACSGKGFKEYVASENPDVICIQESKIKEAAVKKSDLPAGYTYTFIHCEARPGNHGVAVLTKVKPIKITTGISEFKSDNSKHDTEGRVITLEFESFYLVNTYVPNSGTGKPPLARLDYRIKEWDVELQNYLKELDKTKPVVWCGDLNVAHQEIDLKNPKTNTRTAGFTIEERTSFGNFLKEGFVDTFRHLNPAKVAYSFWSYKFQARSKDAGWRLDYFVVSERLMDSIKASFMRSTVMGSDHCPIGIIVDVPSTVEHIQA
ncbi:class II apurinic/apyrimidinic(AP)-endonuclease [Tieghemostelium lacteum]|uniref:DNA-(apurinic or apyrimidinic site) endonuclease n=1 Tax=Tieghemostelium lacteum TaxID=361077 RepID=A0A151ZRV8_TIELA|nr:class II apurinic/apyrimidinic(AP)-endonuclease [Tieghemostelium lacteum]|eukprot:KYQ96733.1 class II apurinic/apyrimidinic(AP)-endonuclease [Tieghemostelium lacteum]